MNKKTMAILIVVLAGLLVWATGSTGSGSLAQGGGGVGPQAVLTPLLQYQGRLTDPGTGEAVADGVYSISFRLYNVESGGSWLWMETEDVSVQGGLFSTVLGDIIALDQSLFNGQALWLGVKVESDAEATPRQQVLPVAYALGLVPGAVVEANSSSAVLQVNNTGSGEAIRVGGPAVLDGDLNVSGSLTGGSHDHDDRYYTKGESDGRFVNTTGPDGMSGNSTDPILEVVQDGTGVGGFFTSASSYGVRGETTSTSPGEAGVLGVAGWTGFTFVEEAGVQGKSFEGAGVVGHSNDFIGVFGRSETNEGVRGEAIGTDPAVFGLNWDGGGPGVYGYGYGTGYGVRGYSSSSHGGYFSSDAGTALYASGSIQSSADSYVWVPAGHAVPHILSVGDDITITPDYNGAVRVGKNVGSGYEGIFIPITLPGVLYGQNVTIEQITIYYRCSSANSYIDNTSLNKQTGATAQTVLIENYDNRTSTSDASYSLTPSPGELNASEGILNLELWLYFANSTDWIQIGGVRVRLGHQ